MTKMITCKFCSRFISKDKITTPGTPRYTNSRAGFRGTCPKEECQKKKQEIIDKHNAQAKQKGESLISDISWGGVWSILLVLIVQML